MDELPEIPSGQEWAELIAAARAGSSAALGRLIQPFARVLRQSAHAHLNQELHVRISESDLVQQTFLEGARDFQSFCGTSAEELLAWLRRILLRNAEDFGRHHRRFRRHCAYRDISLSQFAEELVPHLRVTPESPSTHLVNEEVAARIRSAVHTLPSAYERIVELHYLEGESDAVIARKVRTTPNAIRCLRRRALGLLRTRLQEWRESET